MLNVNVLYFIFLCKSFMWIIFWRGYILKKLVYNFGILVYIGLRKLLEGIFLDVNIVIWDVDKLCKFEELFGLLYFVDVFFFFGGYVKFMVFVWNRGI